MGLQEPCDGETFNEFIFRASESQDAYDLLGPDAPLRRACARGQWMKYADPIKPCAIPQEVAFDGPIPETATPFACICDTGKPCWVERYKYKIVHDFSSFRLPEQPIPVRFRHQQGWGGVMGLATYWRIRGRSIYVTGYLDENGENAAAWVRRAVARGDLLGVSLATGCRVFEFIENVAWVNGKLRDGPFLIARGTPVEELSVTEEGAAADSETYLLALGSPWFDFARYSDCLLSVKELLKLRGHQGREREKFREMHREANERLEQVIARMAQDEHDAAIARNNAEFQQRLESRANDRERFMCSVG
jgi:hypothetical protein